MAKIKSLRQQHLRLYRIWYGMKHRCDKSTDSVWDYYGAKGISYDSKWSIFAGFLEDMLVGYQENLTLDRKDNTKNYSKENCRWATTKKQCNNRSNNRWFTIHGVKKTFAQWIELSGVKSSTVRQRFYAYGWPIERALGFGG